jgi:hypothetical protein
MFKRLNDSCEREGINKTTLILSYIYGFVTQVEAGEDPKIIDLSYAKQDTVKTKIVQVSISLVLKERFSNTLKATNLNASSLVMSYLIHFILQSEKRANIDKSSI